MIIEKRGQSSTRMHFGDYVDQSAPQEFTEINAIMRQRGRDDAVGSVPRSEIPELQSAEMNAYRDAPWAKGSFPVILYFGGLEALFAELKNQIGLRRLRLRRMRFVREQFFLAAAAQNIKRLVRFLSQPTTPLPVTT